MLRTLGRALRILFAPRRAAASVARAPLWFPLVVLSAAAIFSEYPGLGRYGWRTLAQRRLDLTPDGMHATSLLIFVGLMWFAPLLFPGYAWLLGRFVHLYINYAMDMGADRAGVVRVTAYGFLPLAAERLLAGALKLACQEDCNLFNPLAANLAFFLNAKTTSVFAYELARGADLFALWAIILVCAALGAFAEVKPSRFAFPLVFTWTAACLIRAWLLG